MEFKDLIGKTIIEIEGLDEASESITFHFSDGTAACSYHSQDCCESVDVDRIEGNLVSIIGLPIVEADESNDSQSDPPGAESWTWTRQRIKTAAGEVTIVWLGTSNGYYGETPYFQITHGKVV